MPRYNVGFRVQFTGYIDVEAEDMDEAEYLVEGECLADLLEYADSDDMDIDDIYELEDDDA